MIDLKGLNGVEMDRLKKAYQQGRADALEEIEKAMHEAYKGTSHQWECMIFDLIMRELKEQKNEY